MAIKKIYLGTVGPFLYDDTDPINDADGDFPGENFKGLVIDGQGYIGQAPTDHNHIVRKIDLLDLIYPIDSIYFSIASTDPGTIFGGTWARIAEGQFLVGEKDLDADFGTAEATGGSKTHTHDVNPVAVTSSGPSSASSGSSSATTGGPSATISVQPGPDAAVTLPSSTHTHTGGSHSHTISHTHSVDVANTTSTNNSALPPFFVIYAWKRTA